MEVNPFAGSTDWFLAEYEVIYNLIPYTKDHYSILEGREQTAVRGLSMVGGHTIQPGPGHYDILGYVGCFSACPFAEKAQTFVITSVKSLTEVFVGWIIDNFTFLGKA